MENNITTIIINWISYHFFNKYTFWKNDKEIEKDFLDCSISEDLFNFAKEVYEK